MRYQLNNFKNWCNANGGWLTFIAIIVSIFLAFPYNQFNLGAANSFLEKISAVIVYTVEIPISLLLFIIGVLLIYILRVKRKYALQSFSTKFLVGTWKNEWTGNDFSGSEILQITNKGDYLLEGKPCFRVEDFEYYAKTAMIKFTKIGLQPNDPRKLLNTLTIINNDLLTGTEGDYQIKYTRISN
jgi:hypothetical protein